MPDDRSTFHVTDERALGALAHPLRLRLLGLLRADGPATATRLADRLGESSGATSYHLRKLADVGLVAEDRDRGTRRERWWRSAHQMTSWSAADFLGNPDAHRTTIAWRRELYRWQQRLLDQWLAEESEWAPDWVDAAGSSDYLLTLSPQQAKAMSEEIWAVVQRYRQHEQPAASDKPTADKATTDQSARVVWFQHIVPIRGELPL